MRYSAQVCGIWADDLSKRYQAKAQHSKLLEAEAALGKEQFQEAELLALKAIETLGSDSQGEAKADACRSLVKALLAQGRQAEALAKAKDCEVQGSARAKVLLATAEASLGDQLKAMEAAQEARKAFADQGIKYMEVKALLAAAAIQMERGELDLAALDEGLQTAKEARELAIELKDKRLEAMCLTATIDGEGLLVSPDDALNAAEEALDLCLEVQDRSMEAFILCKMSEWNVRLRDFSRAISDAQDAVEIYREMDSPQELNALRLLLQLLLHLAEVREARLIASEALQRFRELGNRSAQIDIIEILVEVHLKSDNLQEAVSASKDGIRLCKEMSETTRQAALMLKLGRGRLNTGDAEKAVAIGEDAWTLLQEHSATKEKVECMQLLCEAKLRQDGAEEALGQVEESLIHFESGKDVYGAAVAAKLCAELQLKTNRFDEAKQNALKAKEAFRKARQKKEEAEALKLCSQVLWKKNEHKAASKMAEEARGMFRQFEAAEEDEVCCLYVQAENSARHAAEEAAQEGSVQPDKPASKKVRTALDESLKAAEAGLKILRFASLAQNPELHGELLCAKAQALTQQSRFDAALVCLDEAVLRFRELEDYQLEANALTLAANNLQFLNRGDEALEALEEAVVLYQHCMDDEGEVNAQKMLNKMLEKRRKPAQRTPDMPAAPTGPMGTPVWEQTEDAPVEAKAQTTATALKTGPALNMSSVTPEMIMGKVREVAAAVTGAESGELEIETPLMEAGMTSASAVLLRELLVKDLPGVNLPVTLAFDYPSISEMSEMIVGSMQAIAN